MGILGFFLIALIAQTNGASVALLVCPFSAKDIPSPLVLEYLQMYLRKQLQDGKCDWIVLFCVKQAVSPLSKLVESFLLGAIF